MSSHSCHVHIDSNYKWEQSHQYTWNVKYYKNSPSVDSLFTCEKISIEQLKLWLQKQNNFFSIIAESPTQIIAAVDSVRSFPIFYTDGGKANIFEISNSARLLSSITGLTEIDHDSELEFRTSCWVGGRRTLLSHIYQLQAGEFLVYEKASNQLIRERFHIFHSREEVNLSEPELIEQLNNIHNDTFKDIIARAGGRPIWVPLSGGWDSRLIVSKLAEFKYKNVQTFSYGIKNNDETKLARRVAALLELPWFEFEVSPDFYKKYFWSDDRKKYFQYSDGLCSAPFMQDIHVLENLKRSGRIPEDAIFINGQSGDFITGGHLPDNLNGEEIEIADLLKRLLDKHYIMWRNLLTPENCEKLLHRLQECILDLTTTSDAIKYDVKLMECWEWQERQAKYVVNGQRAYDMLGYEWELPLWDADYMKFWARVPIDLRRNQYLYKTTLKQTGYRNVFQEIPTDVWRWPGATILIVPIARAAGLLFGNKVKDRIYRTMKWAGHYRFAYGAFGYLRAMREAMIIRDPDSYNIDTWCSENIDNANLLPQVFYD